MLFNNALDKDQIDECNNLGNELRGLDQEEKEFRASQEREFQQHENHLAELKKEKLQNIKIYLEKEKQASKQIYQDKYADELKGRHLTKKQQHYFENELKENLEACDTSMVRKYEQHSKLIDNDMDISREEFAKMQQEKLDEKLNQANDKRDKIAIALRRFLGCEKDDEIDNFKDEVYEQINAMDETIAKSVKLINSEVKKDVADEYGNIETYLRSTTDILARKYLYYKCDELTAALAIALRFPHLTDYHLADALFFAKQIVTNLSDQIINKEIKDISFDEIATELKEDPNLKDKANDILSVIKDELANFAQPVITLFSNLNNAKKREYGNALSSKATDKLMDQNYGRHQLQSQALKYIKTHLNYQNFASQLHGSPLANFAMVENLVNIVYNCFLIENNIQPVVAERLNADKLKELALYNLYLETLNQGKVTPRHDERAVAKPKKLTLAEVLYALETDFAKQDFALGRNIPVPPPPVPEYFETDPGFVDKSAEETKLFLKLFKQNKLPTFKYFINVKNPSQLALKNVVSELSSEKNADEYLKALKEALKKYEVSNSNLGLFNNPVCEESNNANTNKIAPRIVLQK